MDFSSFSYFNPRLREGGDNSTRLSINSCFVFQSTPPRRRRLFHLVNLLLYKEISIHASEKEATTAYDIHTQLFSFQSTPPRRRRRHSNTLLAPRKINFNPRLREGGDLLLYPFSACHSHFNPRLREGGDMCVLLRVCLAIISIHASEKEATNYRYYRSGCFRFQSTPPRRRRRLGSRRGSPVY